MDEPTIEDVEHYIDAGRSPYDIDVRIARALLRRLLAEAAVPATVREAREAVLKSAIRDDYRGVDPVKDINARLDALCAAVRAECAAERGEARELVKALFLECQLSRDTSISRAVMDRAEAWLAANGGT